MIRREQSATTAQTVTDSVVFGDVVQISGVAGSIVVASERPPYRVESWPSPTPQLSVAAARAQPSRLLQPRFAVVPFVGRGHQLDSLSGWMDGDGSVSVQLVYAPGGQGKTRLAEHLVARGLDAGWATWLVRHRAASMGSGGISQLEMPASGRVLAVVDYSDRWPTSHLLALIGGLRDVGLYANVIVRVILLARSAKLWWPTVKDRLSAEFDIEAGAMSLPPLGEELDPVLLFESARASFAERLEVKGTEAIVLPRHLGAEGHVMAVHTAALSAVDAHLRQIAAPSSRHTVSVYLLRREHTHWKALHDRAEDGFSTSANLMRRAVYVATLTGGLSRPDAHAALGDARLASGPQAADQMIDDHCVCYPPSATTAVLEPLYPDRLGEDFIALATPGHAYQSDESGWLVDDWTLHAPEHLLTAASANLAAVWTPAAVSVLIEAADRWPHLASRVLWPLLRRRPDLAVAAGGAAISRIAGIDQIDSAVLEAIDACLPANRHVDLDIGAAAISARLLGPRLGAAKDPAERARLRLALSHRLSRVGRYQEALSLDDEAVETYRQLAAAELGAAGLTTTTTVSLVDALVSRGADLSKVGLAEEAVRSTEEALTICKMTIAAVPALDTAVAPLVATLLSNLGTFLHETGQHEQALALLNEAVTILQQIPSDQREMHRTSLAESLTIVAAVLSDLERHEEAVEAAKEALAIRRILAESEPLSYLPLLAAALNNFGAMQCGLDQYESALSPTQEAIDVYLQVAQANPRRYLPELAGALTNLGLIRMRSGQREHAVVATKEAIAIYQEFAATNPAAHLRPLSIALHNLGMVLAELGRWDEAREPIERAVAIGREHAGTGDPHSRLRGLATLFKMQIEVLLNLEQNEDAVASAQDAIGVYRRLVGIELGTHLPDLARTLLTAGRLLWELQRPADALVPMEEAAGIFRRLTTTDPATYRRLLSASLVFHAAILSALGRPAEARTQAREAIEILRRLNELDPDLYRLALAQALREYAAACAASGRDLTDARTAIEESVHLLLPLTNQQGGIIDVAIVAALRTMSEVLDRLGYTSDATYLRDRLDEARTSPSRTDIAIPFSSAPKPAAIPNPPLDVVTDTGTGTARSPDDAAITAFTNGMELLEREALDDAYTAFEQAKEAGLSSLAMLYQGVVRYKQGNPTGAMINWIVITAFPDTYCAPIAEFYLGVLCAEQGDVQPAKNLLRRTINAGHPERAPKAALRLAQLLGDLGEQDEAQAAYRVAYRVAFEAGDASTVAAATAGLGALLVEHADIPGASAIYRSAFEPTDGEISIELGTLLRDHGYRDAALATLRHTATSTDVVTAAAGLFGIGRLLHESGETDGAQEAYNQAIALGQQPFAARAAVNFGALLYAQDDRAGAEAVWQLAFDSNDPYLAVVAARNLGTLHRDQGDKDGARFFWQFAIDSGDPEMLPAAAGDLGDFLRELGDLDGACAAFRLAIDSGHPKYAPRAALGLGMVLHRRGDPVGARAAYQVARTAGGLDHQMSAAFGLGQVMFTDGDLEGAAASFRIATELGETTGVATLGLGLALDGLRDEDGARAAYEQTIESGHPDQAAAAAFYLGLLLHSQGDTKGAQSAWTTAAAGGHTNYAPQAVFNLAVTLREEGEVDAACAAFQQAAQSGHHEIAPAAAIGLADLLHEQGEIDAACEALRPAAESAHFEHAPAASFRLAVLLQEKGQIEAARTALTMAAESGHPTWAPRAKDSLKGLP